MIPSQTYRDVPGSLTAAAATNATAATTIDTWDANGRPFEHCTLYLEHAAATATDSSAKWTGARVLEGATTSISSATAISGLTGTTNSTATSTQFVLPAHNDTTNACIIRIDMPLLTRGRYLFVETTSSADTVATRKRAVLTRGQETPDSATELGAVTMVQL